MRVVVEGHRPVTILICARGGEGGGVLMSWIQNAAVAAGLPVQTTSVPGVAQRTGATTYYLEILPLPFLAIGEREPVLGLYPSIGDLDLVVASELLEVGRAIERGWVQPERTVLIGSTHRVFSIAEKSAGDDGRYDGQRVLDAAPQMARRALLFDAQEAAQQCDCRLNAVLAGAIAGCGQLPMAADVLAEAIRREGKATAANLAGFNRGLALATSGAGAGGETTTDGGTGAPASPMLPDGALAIRVQSFPESCQPTLQEATRRLEEFQDSAYVDLYLRRLEALLPLDGANVIARTARQLALLMSYEDVIRVAQLKTCRGRFSRIRLETGAASGDIVRVTEFLKPSLEELCSLLPSFLARPILRWSDGRGLTHRLAFGLELRTSTVLGFLQLWIIARLRSLRRLGHRYREEQSWIDEWLELVHQAWALDPGLALELVECAGLVKGYGETRRRGIAHFRRIVDRSLWPALAGDVHPRAAISEIHGQRTLAMAEPESWPRAKQVDASRSRLPIVG